jgi:triosephosphate isomerase
MSPRRTRLIAETLALPDVDGALAGGASLDPESFARIVEIARGLVATGP